jgi:large subunit ribosomal protein L6e
MNRAYLILTKTHVNVSKVDLSHVQESLFRGKKIRRKKTKDFAGKEDGEKKGKKAVKKVSKKHRSPELLDLQKRIDKPLIAAIKKVPRMGAYLKAHFTLTNTQRPHMMRF